MINIFDVLPSVGDNPVATALAPLGSNLLYAVHFESSIKRFSVYDPNGTFSLSLLPQLLPPGADRDIDSVHRLTHLVPGLIYGLFLIRAQTVTLEGVAHDLLDGANLIVW